MTDSTQRTVLIVGAGLGGSLLAVMLGRRGYRVLVRERRPDPRVAGFVGGRSINLALSERGIDALRRVDLDQKVLAEAIRMPGRMIHPVHGEPVFQPYSADADDAINSVSRSGLNITLIEAAESIDSVEFVFDERCVDVDLKSTTATVRSETTGQTSEVAADLIVGADGAFSAVRGVMEHTERFDYSQSYLAHGYKELHIPPAGACGVDPTRFDGFAMDPNALHIWPRGGAMMIALPNPDRSFTATLFWPFAGRHSFESLADSHDRVGAFFKKHYPDAARIMPTLEADYAHNPTSSLATIRCQPWHRGRVVLIGDAAHAIVPFYGQGMIASFEDCVWLCDRLDAAGGDPAAAIERFSADRKPHADAIADLALENFIEMRDKVGTRRFRLHKKIEQGLHRMLPGWYTPLYNLISFSTMPYADARRQAQRKNLVVAGVVVCVVAAMGLAVLLAMGQITELVALVVFVLVVVWSIWRWVRA